MTGTWHVTIADAPPARAPTLHPYRFEVRARCIAANVPSLLAPVDAILAAYTIAPFDDCGGRVNPHVGYHYHAVTDCLAGVATTIAPVHADTVAAHAGPIGIAMNGHAIFAHVLANGEAPGTLDACNGHEA